MREQDVETALRRAMEDRGGLCLKFTCPGHTGVPDRLCLMPCGVAAFVEVKRPGKKIDPDGLQAYWQKRLRGLGFPAWEVTSCKEAAGTAEALQLLSEIATAEAGEGPAPVNTAAGAAQQ